MKQDSKLRRSGAVIMANLILLLGSLAYIISHKRLRWLSLRHGRNAVRCGRRCQSLG